MIPLPQDRSGGSEIRSAGRFQAGSTAFGVAKTGTSPLSSKFREKLSSLTQSQVLEGNDSLAIAYLSLGYHFKGITEGNSDYLDIFSFRRDTPPPCSFVGGDLLHLETG